MSKYLFTICGRAGSKGIKGKNSSLFLGIPLVYYTLAAIKLYQDTHAEDDLTLALNTDSTDLKELLDASGVPYEFIARKEELAGDSVPKVDVIRATYQAVKDDKNEDYDAVIDLDITSPLRTLKDIEALLDKRKNSDAGVIYTVVPSRRNPYFNMVQLNEDGTCSRVIETNVNARQQAPQVFDMNASIYAYSIDFMQSSTGIFEVSNEFILMEDTAVLDLDNKNDLRYMEIIAQYLFEHEEAYGVLRKIASGFCDGGQELTSDWVYRQLKLYGGANISPYFEEAKKRSLKCFAKINNKYFQEGTIDPLHTGQYAIFLYYLARVAFEHGNATTASKVYALNKALHGFDIFYEVEMPEVFFMEHPVGTVLGRARYSDRLFVGQNVTVGGNKGSYPTIGENVAIHAGAIVVGDAHIGNNVEISAGAFIKGETIPDNCLVFGQSPNLIIKQRSEEEMLGRLYYFRD